MKGYWRKSSVDSEEDRLSFNTVGDNRKIKRIENKIQFNKS